jgi:hypothetical protein
MAFHSARARYPGASFREGPQVKGYALLSSNEHHLYEFGRGDGLHDWNKDGVTGMKECREDGTIPAYPVLTGIRY